MNQLISLMGDHLLTCRYSKQSKADVQDKVKLCNSNSIQWKVAIEMTDLYIKLVRAFILLYLVNYVFS